MTKALRGAFCVGTLQKPTKKPQNRATGVNSIFIVVLEALAVEQLGSSNTSCLHGRNREIISSWSTNKEHDIKKIPKH